MAGRLIVFEGIDGSGLSTQSARLHSYLREGLRLPAFLTKEPTDGPAGAAIRLRLRGRLAMDEATLALFFAADRLDHLAADVLPRLQAGIHVISDRYYLSSLAYQSMALDAGWLRAINTRCRPPDLTIFLDVPVEVCLARLKAERWRPEWYETAEKLAEVRRNYLRFIPQLRRSGERIVVVQGTADGQEREIGAVAADVAAAVETALAG